MAAPPDRAVMATSVGEVIARYLSTLGNPNTRRTYEQTLGLLHRALLQRGVVLTTLSAPIVAECLDEIEASRGLKRSAAQVHWGAARGLLRWAAHKHLLADGLADALHPPAAGSPHTPKPPPAKEVLNAVEHATFGWSSSPARDRVIALLVLHGGLLVQEVMALDWEEVDLDARFLQLRSEERGRTVPLTPALHRALTAFWRSGGLPGPVVLNQRGAPLSERGVHGVISSLGEHVGQPGLTARALRGAFLQRQVAAGVGHAEAAERAGLASANVLRRRLGLLNAEAARCTRCDGCVSLGRVSGRCIVCFGTGSVLTPPAGFVRRLTRQRGAQRMRAAGTEIQRFAAQAAASGVVSTGVAEALVAIAVALQSCANALDDDDATGVTLEETLAAPLVVSVVTQRLRALGTDLRKLGLALASRGWIAASESRWMQGVGADLTLMAVAIEDGRREIELHACAQAS